MSDRELLELAATAAGFNDAEWAAEKAAICTVQAGKGFRPFWNPLNDDGDALRLAVKLKLKVYQAEFVAIVSLRMSQSYISENYEDNGDHYAATRRAIVRAAAEIGRQMQSTKGD